MSGKVVIKIGLEFNLKVAADKAAANDLRSLDNSIEIVLRDYLIKHGYLPGHQPQVSEPLIAGEPITNPSAGTLISEARKRLGISQEELGKRCGVTKGVVSQWENDIGAPKRANARKLAVVLGIKPLELEARLSGGPRKAKK